ncbi:OTU-like cysteine protease domain-containing protein [Ditylenchus destructor]|uniref:OTU-like cysteine protease domain-containing protein n=1 Tax=Ditylenchus destructor TaxID=166010 RepID=A0AAD4MLI1_9BILA|nr:OTU-like cysteine protease domain-containing protein [Ditylenchus destructor]
MGSLQHISENLRVRCCNLVDNFIVDNFQEKKRARLQKFVAYFKKQWLPLRKFFSLTSLPEIAPHTTNNCEAYHSKQKVQFQPKMKLGSWLYRFRELNNLEIRNCENCETGAHIEQRFKEHYLDAAKVISEQKRILNNELHNQSAASEEEYYEPSDNTLLEAMLKIGSAIGAKPISNKKRLISDKGVELQAVYSDSNDDDTESIPNKKKRFTRKAPRKSSGVSDHPSKKGNKKKGKLSYRGDFKKAMQNEPILKAKRASRTALHKNKPSLEAHDVVVSPVNCKIVFKFPSNGDRRRCIQTHGLECGTLTPNQEDSLFKEVNTRTFCPLRVRDIKPDGNCLFNAVSQAISAMQNNARELRKLACKYIHDHRHEKWAEDWVGPEWTIENTEKEASEPGDTAQWGRTLHTIALAKLLNVEILVYQPDGLPKFQLYTPTMKSAPSIKNKQDPNLGIISLILNAEHYNLIEDVKGK